MDDASLQEILCVGNKVIEGMFVDNESKLKNGRIRISFERKREILYSFSLKCCDLKL
jgi:hypothetical protein